MIDRLFDAGYRFDFFQAVRVLQRFYREQSAGNQDRPRLPVGVDSPASQEFVRFRSTPAMGFPATEVSLVRPAPLDEFDEKIIAPAQAFVTFMGLTGAAGILPDHYTRLLCERLRDGDAVLHEFLDLFHHRLLSLFYRAWEKHSVAASRETAKVYSNQDEDLFTQCLYGLVGFGTGCLRERLDVPEESLLYYSGHFTCAERPAAGLEDMLSDHFGFPVEVAPFAGRWLHLNEDDLTKLPCPAQPSGRYAVLGVDLVLGTRVWDIQSRYQLRLGPLTYEQFVSVLPIGENFLALTQAARLYVGFELDFDLQPTLLAKEIPEPRLDSAAFPGARLGWNSWLHVQPPTKNAENVYYSLDTLDPSGYLVRTG